MSRIDQAFNNLRSTGKKALIPYIMSGHPDIKSTKRYVKDLESAGADMIELGVPFSDPLADGPTIQKASEWSVKRGVTLKKVLSMVSDIRKTSEIPLILMTYYNPIFKFGSEAFVRAAVRSGVDGVIIPDLIPDEADEFIRSSRKHGLDTIFLLAPTSTKDRINKVKKSSTGFIYYVSITGITGSKITINKHMRGTLDMIRKSTGKPVAVGFGISSPRDASSIAPLADGVIIGSAIVNRISQGKGIKKFVQDLRKAI